MPALLQYELIETALRVLSRWAEGRGPAVDDAEALTKIALPEERSLEIDQLACRIVERAFSGRNSGH